MVSPLELVANVGTRHVLYLQCKRSELQLHGFVFDKDWVAVTNAFIITASCCGFERLRIKVICKGLLM